MARQSCHHPVAKQGVGGKLGIRANFNVAGHPGGVLLRRSQSVAFLDGLEAVKITFSEFYNGQVNQADPVTGDRVGGQKGYVMR
jgi:hypothetical protein